MLYNRHGQGNATIRRAVTLYIAVRNVDRGMQITIECKHIAYSILHFLNNF